MGQEPDRIIEMAINQLSVPDVATRYNAIKHLGLAQEKTAAEAIENILLSAETNHLMILSSGLEALAKIRFSPQRAEILEKFAAPCGGSKMEPMLVFPLMKYLAVFGTVESFPYIERVMDLNPILFAKEIIDAVTGIIENNGVRELPPTLQERLEFMQTEADDPAHRTALEKILSWF